MIEEVWAEVQPMWFTVAISSLNVRLLFHVIIFMLSVRKHHIWHIRAKRKGGLEVRCLCVCMYVCVYHIYQTVFCSLRPLLQHFEHSETNNGHHMKVPNG